MGWLWFFSEIIFVIQFAGGLACNPKISVGSNSKPDADGHIFIECEISTCAVVHMILYDKTGIGITERWTSVYEGFNKTYYHALETGTNYTLKDRNDYTAFPTKHILNVQHLIIEDHGEWRCVVVGENMNYESNSIDVTVYVTPKEDSIVILPNNPALVEAQTSDFICLVDGIHPEPNVVWKVNGVEYADGKAANTQHENGLWLVNNTIPLGFTQIGPNVVSCIMKTDRLDPWLHTYSWQTYVMEDEAWIENHIDIDIKEPASVLYPQEDINVTDNDDTSFTLKCIGSGFKPNITWTKDGVTILDTNLTYTITQQCNASFCMALLSPIQDPDMACLDSQHSGVFKCNVSLKKPYQSAQISPDFKVFGLGNMCSPHHLKLIIGSTVIGIGTAVLVVGLLLYCRKRRNNLQRKTCDDTPSTPTVNYRANQNNEDCLKSSTNVNGDTNIQFDNSGFVESIKSEEASQLDKKDDVDTPFDEKTGDKSQCDQMSNHQTEPVCVTSKRQTEQQNLLDDQNELEKITFRDKLRRHSVGPQLLRDALRNDYGHRPPVNVNDIVTQVKDFRKIGPSYQRRNSDFDRRISDPLLWCKSSPLAVYQNMDA